MEVTSTYSFTSPENSHQPLPSNPEEWIAHLVSSQTTDPKDWLAFKQSKRVLKDYAKRGELSKKQRRRVLSILSQKGFRTYRNNPRFRGLPVCPTKLLLFSPKLYEILFYPKKYPIESALLNTLSDDAFMILTDTFDEREMYNILPSHLVEITYVITCLSIPELEQICKNSLKNQQLTKINDIGMKSFYLLATIWDRLSLFSCPLTFTYDFPLPDSREVAAKEFESFKQVMTGTKELEELSPPELYRLFFLIHEESKISPTQIYVTRISPTLCSLRLKIFDRLLNYLKSGELNAEYSQQLIAEVQGSFDLCKRLKEDQLTIRLKSIKISISLWSIFPNSSLIQALILSCMKQGKPLEEIPFEDVTEESFWLLYNFWMTGNKINVNALSIKELSNLLLIANYLQLHNFDNTRKQIETAIIEQCDNTQESMIVLAQIGFSIFDPALRHVISWLNSFSFLSIREVQEDQKDILKVEIKGLPSLEYLQSALKVLKVILSNLSIKIELLQDVVEPWKKSLCPLIYLHCCIELGLVQEQQFLETQILNFKNLEEIEDGYKWKNFHSWGPYDFLNLLDQLPDNISSHLLALDQLRGGDFHSAFWQSVKLCARVDTKALKEEMSRFRDMALEPQKILELSPEELLRFFFFLPHAIREFDLDKSIVFSTLLDNFSSMMSKYIKEKTLLTDTLAQIIQQVQEFYPQEGHFIKELKFISDHLQLPIHLLMNNIQGLIKIILEVKTGTIFNDIPPKSIEWALEMIQRALFSDSKSALINLQELKGFSAAHLDALQYLQKSGFNINETIKKIAEELSSVVDQLPPETLCVVALWAAVNKNYALMKTCLLHSCHELKFKLPRDDFEIGTYTLTSLQATPLKILEALGTDVKHLKIKINTDSEALEDPWVKIAKICPHVTKLYLEITGTVTSLDSLPLTQFSNLRDLELLAHDSEAWKSLCSLKIPATIERICLEEIHRNQIEEISNYEFFSHLPSKRITLKLTDDSSKSTSSWWSYLSLAADPVEKLFRQLSHCTELRIYGRGNFLLPLEYLVTHNQQLESLFLSHSDACPAVDDLQKLKNGLPKLKKFDIEFGFDSSLEPSRIDDLIKFLKEWQEKSKDSTEITWQHIH